MASLGHVAVGLAAGRIVAGRRPGASRTMAFLGALSLAPDLDVIGMGFDVPYGATWGHRGATHSIALAIAAGMAIALLMREKESPRRFAPVVVAVLVSHGLLDALTDGGRGIALLWPWTTERFFFPWRPIPVAPIGAGILSLRGLRVLLWEAVVFAPAWLWALWPRRTERT